MERQRRPLLARLMLLVCLSALVPAAALVGSNLYLGQRARAHMERQIDAALDLAINLEKSLIDARLTRMRDAAASLAGSAEVTAALSGGGDPGPIVQRAHQAFPAADLITVVDRDGVVRGRATTGLTGDTVSYGGLVAHVIEGRAPAAAAERIPPAELAPEGRRLESQVRIPVLPTAGSSDGRPGTVLTDALALMGAAPVLDSAGRVLGAVIAGDVLNNDFTIVDEVTARSPQGLPLNATIALDGIRVTTNVPAKGGGQRAVGTLYSDPVMAKLRAGEDYRGRALVGGWQWQRTIYIPLADHAGRIVAGPYVGVPEAYFTGLAGEISGAVWIGITVAVLALSGALAVAIPLPQAIAAGVRESLAGSARVARGVQAASGQLQGAAQQAAAAARGALQVAGAALAAAEQAGASARRATGRVRELELALARIAAGAEEQARAIQHVGAVSSELGAALRSSREVLGAVLTSARAAFLAAQQGRQGALQTLAALELMRAAARPAGQEPPPGAAAAGGEAALARVIAELERGQAVAEAVECDLRRAAQAGEEVLNRLWDLAAVLGENGARLAAITEQMADVSAVVSGTTATARMMGDASREITGALAGMADGSEEALGRLRQVQDQVARLAEASRAIAALSEQIQALARELEQAGGGGEAWPLA